MIYLKKIDEKFLINADRRTKRFNEKYGRKTAQEDVVMPQQTIDALSEGELVRGAFFVDECGTVRFTPYDIGGGLKLGPRKPEPVTPTKRRWTSHCGTSSCRRGAAWPMRTPRPATAAAT